MPTTAPVPITEYVAPRAAGEKVAALVTLALYGAGAASPWVTPDSAAWELLATYLPGGLTPERILALTRTLVAVLAGVHGLEVLLFDQLRLKKHGVPRFSSVWWQWSLTVFVEGVGAWARFGKLVTEKSLKAK
ncbi:hypothetical protein PWT90_10377 [Aphanocladium album]|nr:hypothetical protein PWT90_10377 [Aphanocladium album]